MSRWRIIIIRARAVVLSIQLHRGGFGSCGAIGLTKHMMLLLLLLLR